MRNSTIHKLSDIKRKSLNPNHSNLSEVPLAESTSNRYRFTPI